MSKIMNVYYGQDTLPYKDKECKVHFPIIGQTFSGSSLVDTIKFYVDNIGGTSSITWVAIVKRADGSIAYQQLSDNFDSDGVYVSLPLVSYYTEKKGDIYITLNGYMGGVTVTEDENNVYHVEGTPIVQVSGAIKLTIAYAPTMPQNAGALEIITVQSALAAVTEKLDKNSPYFIKVVSNIDSNVINTPTYLPYLNSGDIVYSDYNKKFYKISGVAGSYVATEVELELGSLKVGTLDIGVGINVDSFADIYSENEESNLKGYIANELSTKVDKEVTGGDEIYAHHGSNQVLLPYAKGVYADNIPQRDSNGQINVPQTPTANEHATSKKYVDSFGKSIVATIDSSNYKMTITLKDNNGNTLGTPQVVDLPLESIVTSATYYDSYTYEGTTYTQVIVITLATTDVPTIVPVGDLVSGLVSESQLSVVLEDYALKSETYTKTEVDTALGLKADKSDTYTKTQVDTALSDKADKVGALPSYSVSATDSVLDFLTNNNLEGKSFIFTFGSGNGFICVFNQYSATSYNFEIEVIGNAIRYVGTNVDLSGKDFMHILSSTYRRDYEIINNKVTSISSSSTDTQYPSAKCVWDECQNIREVAEGKNKTYILKYSETIASVKTELDGVGYFYVYNSTTKEWENKLTELVNGDYDNVNISNSAFNSQNNYVTISYGLIFRAIPQKSLSYIENYKTFYYLPYPSVTPTLFKLGDIFLVVETDVPDRWVGQTLAPLLLYALESKINLTGYSKIVDIPKYQATTIIVQNALTNINGRTFQNYTATLNTTNYTYYLIQKNGNNLTKEEASEYMKYMCGSEYVPEYNYDFPRNTLFIFADNSIWKPQYDNVNGLLLYKVSDGFYTKSQIDTMIGGLVRELSVDVYAPVGDSTELTGVNVQVKDSNNVVIASGTYNGDTLKFPLPIYQTYKVEVLTKSLTIGAITYFNPTTSSPTSGTLTQDMSITYRYGSTESITNLGDVKAFVGLPNISLETKRQALVRTETNSFSVNITIKNPETNVTYTMPVYVLAVDEYKKLVDGVEQTFVGARVGFGYELPDDKVFDEREQLECESGELFQSDMFYFTATTGGIGDKAFTKLVEGTDYQVGDDIDAYKTQYNVYVFKNALGDTNEVRYGSNIYHYSNIHKWLNALGDNWFSPSYVGDILASGYSGKKGFLSWLDADTLALIEDNVAYGIYERSGQELPNNKLYCKVCLLSGTEIAGSVNNNEGTVFDYWKYLNGGVISNNANANRTACKITNITSKSTFWLRSPSRGSSHLVWYVGGNGNVSYSSACVSYAVLPTFTV